MTTLLELPRPRRTEEFARVLDGGQTADVELAALAQLAHSIPAIPAQPRAEFRDQLRKRLVAVAAVTTPEPEPSKTERVRAWANGWRARRVAQVTAGSMAGVIALSGVAVASSRSLPGDPFYGVKRATESVRLYFAGSQLDRGRLYLHFARVRLSEVASLARQHGGSGDILSTLGAMDSDTKSGSRDLATVWKNTHQLSVLRYLAQFSSQQKAALTAVAGSLPAAAQQTVSQELAFLTRLQSGTTQVIAACAHGCPAAGSGTTHPGTTAVPTGAPSAPAVPATPNVGSSQPGSSSTSAQPSSSSKASSSNPQQPQVSGTPDIEQQINQLITGGGAIPTSSPSPSSSSSSGAAVPTLPALP